jgi:hypothetical protein
VFRQKSPGVAAYFPNDWRVIPANAIAIRNYRRSAAEQDKFFAWPIFLPESLKVVF